MPRPSRYRRNPPVSLFAFQDIIAAVTGVMLLATMLLMLELVTRTFAATIPTPDGMPDEVKAERVELQEQRDRLLDRITQNIARASPEIVTQTQLGVLEAELRRRQEETRSLEEQVADARDTLHQLETQRQTDAEAIDTLVRELAETQQQLDVALSRTRVTLLEGDRADKQAWFLLCEGDRVTAATVSDDNELTPRLDLPRDGPGLLRWAERLKPAENVFVLMVRADGIGQFETLQQALRTRGFEVGWDLTTPELAAAFHPTPAGVAP
ncbi:MAG: hypothetical protein AAF333_04410 [Planctomycetota bacterium]